MVPLFAGMLERDRKRWGLRVCRAAWLLGVSVREYRELEAGTALPSPDTYDRICELFGWPQRFVRPGGSGLDWEAAETFLAELNPAARRTLLGLLTSPPGVRSAGYARLSGRDDGQDLAELLLLLEEKEWARTWFILRLQELGSS